MNNDKFRKGCRVRYRMVDYRKGEGGSLISGFGVVSDYGSGDLIRISGTKHSDGDYHFGPGLWAYESDISPVTAGTDPPKVREAHGMNQTIALLLFQLRDGTWSVRLTRPDGTNRYLLNSANGPIMASGYKGLIGEFVGFASPQMALANLPFPSPHRFSDK